MELSIHISKFPNSFEAEDVSDLFNMATGDRNDLSLLFKDPQFPVLLFIRTLFKTFNIKIAN